MTPEEIKAENERQRQELRSQVQKTVEANAEAEKNLEEAYGREVQDVQKTLDGQDLEWNPEVFIAYGKISKVNIPVLIADEKSGFPGLLVDMQSLTGAEKTLAKLLVIQTYPKIEIGGIEWNDMLTKASVAMALTRMNKRPYPIPSAGDVSFDVRMKDKQALLGFIHEAQDFVGEMLRMLYINLSNADSLKMMQGEDVLKK